MTKKKSTKRALLMSALSLMMCVTMFVGSTFAWFTDSATSGSNVITAGNLDMEVQYTLDGTNWKGLDGASDLFQKGLWEPGHTEVVVLKIENKGSLALKYAANMNIVDETLGKTKDNMNITLSDILTVSTLTIEAAGTDPVFGLDIAAMTLEKAFQGESDIGWGTASSFKAGNVLEKDMQLFSGSTHYVFVKVDMAENVGNEANHNGTDIPEINFGINVMATQYTYENDSFGNDYDENAEYVPMVTTLAQFREALAKGGNIVLGADIEMTSTDLLFAADGGNSTGTGFLVRKDTVIDFNGHTLSVNVGSSYSNSELFWVKGCTMTLKGEGGITTDTGNVVFVHDAAAELNIEGGNYVHTCSKNDPFYTINGKINVTNGKISTAYWNTINIQGSGRTDRVDVSGGSFEGWNPAKSPDGNLLADGYKTVSEVIDGVTWYNVVPE